MEKTFNIDDVAHIHHIETLKRVGGEVFAVCPFCGDNRGKFSYVIQKGKKKNIYNCFVSSCGAHGDAIDLHIALSTGNYSGPNGRKKAAIEIFKALEGDTTYEDHKKMVEESMVYTNEAERASDERCSSVYYAMLKRLVLKDEHKNDLLRRGFSEADIKRFKFRSTPSMEEKYKLIDSLISDGYDLDGVPGFFTNKKNKWDLKIPGSGYFCPVFDGERNIIAGFQIRVDEPKDGAKYLWLSSSGRENGVSSGALSTYLPGEDQNTVIITEGILKATCIYSLLNSQITVIGVPGVNCIKGAGEYLDRLDSTNAYVFEAYDMEKGYTETDAKKKEKKETIEKAANVLKEYISEYGLETHTLVWDLDKEGVWREEFKGLDDFLLSYERKDIFVAYLKKKTSDHQKMMNFLS